MISLSHGQAYSGARESLACSRWKIRISDRDIFRLDTESIVTERENSQKSPSTADRDRDTGRLVPRRELQRVGDQVLDHGVRGMLAKPHGSSHSMAGAVPPHIGASSPMPGRAATGAGTAHGPARCARRRLNGEKVVSAASALRVHACSSTRGLESNWTVAELPRQLAEMATFRRGSFFFLLFFFCRSCEAT